MFKKILVAVDSSEQSKHALSVANDLCAALAGARLGVVHVVDLTPTLVPEVAVFDERLAREQRDQGEMLLSEAQSRLHGEFDCERFMPDGSPAERIAGTAKEWQADMIIMGSHGRGRFAAFILGSTAAEVLRVAPCPVLLVR